MINTVNTQYLSIDERRASLDRAIHSQPFFNLLEFEPVGAADNVSQYAAKSKVDKDFWITEVKSNQMQIFLQAGTFYKINLYAANEGKSLLRYVADEDLPAIFQSYDCPINAGAPGVKFFQDTQEEILPHLVKRGNSIVARIQNVSNKTGVPDINFVLAGYYTYPRSYMKEFTTQEINSSLERPVTFDQWKFDVDFEGRDIRKFQNDRFPRMVLGFQIVAKDNQFAGLGCDGTFLITDSYREMKFNNVPINIAFFAPKINQVIDTHIYYLPVEYLWEPFAPLKFEIENALNGSDGYELVMLTRTV